MTAIRLDGVATATAIKAELTERVAALRAAGIAPGLGTLLVGSDPGSVSYVGGKHRDSAEVGIESIRVELPDTASEAEVRRGARLAGVACGADPRGAPPEHAAKGARARSQGDREGGAP